MILAAADYGRDSKRNAPPPELSLAFKAIEWGALPEPGGLRDQRLGEIDRMTSAINVYRVFQSYHDAKNKKEWREQHPEYWEIYLNVLELKDG